MKLLYISLIESIYLIYMFHFLTTTVDFNFMESPTGDFFKHAIGDEKTYRICPFGQYAIFLLIAILIGRNFLYISNFFVITSIIIASLLSLMNMNALVYLLPVVITEAYQYYSKRLLGA